MAIRYDDKLISQMKSIQNRVNRKLARLEKQSNSKLNQWLPSKVSIQELKTQYTDRTELKRHLKDLERFTKRGSEKMVQNPRGASIPEFVLANAKAERFRTAIQYTRKIKTYGGKTPKIAGTKQDATYAQMGDARLQTLEARRKAIAKDVSNMTEGEFKKYLQQISNLEYQLSNEALETFQDNFIKALDVLSTYYEATGDKRIPEIQEKIRELSPEEMGDLYEDELLIQLGFDQYHKFWRMSAENRLKMEDEVTDFISELYAVIMDM